MKTSRILISLLLLLGILAPQQALAQNPYLPLWEYIPDGEPYVFEDPDQPGKYRVYIYGSHDTRLTDYCGLEQVTWSASVDDLSNWRYDGIIFESKTDANGKLLHEDGSGDVLFAPDVAEVIGKDGKKTYYLFPNNQNGGRQNMVAKADRPDGPFKTCNWDPKNPTCTVGMFGFDPGVLVDDDGRAYGYWGFGTSYAAELDPETMATPIMTPIKELIPGYEQDSIFRFFEASSMRKVGDKYVLVYSRFTNPGEFGLDMSNYTLAYAYSDYPLGPFTYGGTIIDGRGRDTDPDGNPIFTAHPNGNTHGSIIQIKDQWYVFYHRQCGTDEFSRQAMVAPIEVSYEPGKGGKVTISEAEYTSEGFALNGLDPLKRYSAGIACYYTGPKPAVHEWPNKQFFGSYVEDRREEGKLDNNPVINNTDGSVVGYKYFNFDAAKGIKRLALSLTPHGVGGTIDIYLDSPWEVKGGKKIGTLRVPAADAKSPRELHASLRGIGKLTGKHALFLKFSSPVKEKSICTLHELQLKK